MPYSFKEWLSWVYQIFQTIEFALNLTVNILKYWFLKQFKDLQGNNAK